MNLSEYQLIIKEDGSKSLRRYLREYDYWVTLDFVGENQEELDCFLAQIKKFYLEKNWKRGRDDQV